MSRYSYWRRCGVALLLAKITHGLLIGESATPENRACALRLAASVDGVERVTPFCSMYTLSLGATVHEVRLVVRFVKFTVPKFG